MADGVQALFIDTGAFYARFDEDDQFHEQAVEWFDRLADGSRWRPIFTSGYVLGELSGLILRKKDAVTTSDRVQRVWTSNLFTVLQADEATFSAACERHYLYEDQSISLVDHLSGVLAKIHDVEHVLTFDPDDFETLGLSPVPRDIPG